MTLGVILLCHTALDRAAEVARHWAKAGCPVVIHLDRRVIEPDRAAIAAALADLQDVRFSPRVACEWGTFSLVEATIAAASQMLADFPGVGHVYLASGSCVPIRPVAHLRSLLQAHPGTDFIESVTTADVGWTVGGLNKERFTLRFPFSWKRQRRAFDAYVRLQRRLRVQRRIPAGIVPHLGSQWWCLTRSSLQAILSHPQRATYDRYFRRVWIPDESYFQTLIRQVSTRVESRSLTLSKFDFQGRPHLFYDDHLHLLRQSEAYVARKIWPQANKLYQVFLAPAEQQGERAEPNPGKIDRSPTGTGCSALMAVLHANPDRCVLVGAYALGKAAEEIEGKPFIQLIAGPAWDTGQFPSSLHDLAERLKRRYSERIGEDECTIEVLPGALTMMVPKEGDD